MNTITRINSHKKWVEVDYIDGTCVAMYHGHAIAIFMPRMGAWVRPLERSEYWTASQIISCWGATRHNVTKAQFDAQIERLKQ